MRNRRDIPTAETFRRLVDSLYAVAGSNRAVQGPKLA
jgi:hypothetical protein